MLIIPQNCIARVAREFKRSFRRFDVVGTITLAAALATLIGFFYGGFPKHAAQAPYCLAALAFVLMSHYCRNYFMERRHSENVRSVLENFHHISEHIRNVARKVNDSLTHKDAPIDTPQWAEEYIRLLRQEGRVICKELQHIMCKLGYPVHGVCIKSYDKTSMKVHVVARSDEQRSRGALDSSEDSHTNPFFRLLREVHTHYKRHIGHEDLQHINQNMVDLPLRYLAIGDIENPALPRVFSQILAADATKYEPADADAMGDKDIVHQLCQRTAQRYCSCLGMMITTKVTVSEQIDTEDYRGFIGLDSMNRDAWEFLDPWHLHAVASVADSLYCMLVFYQEAQHLVAVSHLHLAAREQP